jgi:hypothetical protein
LHDIAHEFKNKGRALAALWREVVPSIICHHGSAWQKSNDTWLMKSFRSRVAKISHAKQENTLTDCITCENSELFKDYSCHGSIYNTNEKRQSCKQKELANH